MGYHNKKACLMAQLASMEAELAETEAEIEKLRKENKEYEDVVRDHSRIE